MHGAVAALRPLLRQLMDDERLRLFQRAVEASTDAVIITEAEPLDAPGPAMVYANPANERVTGYATAEVLGQSPRMFQGPATGLGLSISYGIIAELGGTIDVFDRDGGARFILHLPHAGAD
jgi:PAS domain-containing protein